MTAEILAAGSVARRPSGALQVITDYISTRASTMDPFQRLL